MVTLSITQRISPMKCRILGICAFLLSIASPMIADSISDLYAPVYIECELKPIIRKNSRDPHPIAQGLYPHIPPQHTPDVLQAAYSTNWSGYASATSFNSPTRNSVSAVYGTWTVPALKAPSTVGTDTYCSIWVGIDGYFNGTVEQLGTEHDWYYSSPTDRVGSQINYAWFEMYPGGAYEIVGFPVNVHDVISASVTYPSTNTFQLTINNQTRHVSFVVPSSYTKSSVAQRTSAEWIVEAPYYNGILPLADFITATLTNCTATINGRTGPIANNGVWANQSITMVTTNGIIKSLPSALTQTNTGTKRSPKYVDSFHLTWEHQ